MELYKDILIKLLEKETVQVTFPDLKMDLNILAEMKCYHAMRYIQHLIRDETLDDAECFKAIEKVICAYEQELGSDGGFRHDFG